MASARAWPPGAAASFLRGAGPRDASGCPPELSEPVGPLVTLRTRAEFLSVRGGGRWAGPAFVLEGKARATSGPHPGPRFGFTITKRLGSAVVRNRIRRRLREALRTEAMFAAQAGIDYVIVARQAALKRPFPDLVADFRQGFTKVHRASGARRQAEPPRQ